MTYYARSAPAKRLILNQVQNKRERLIRHNTRIAHENLIALSDEMQVILSRTMEGLHDSLSEIPDSSNHPSAMTFIKRRTVN